MSGFFQGFRVIHNRGWMNRDMTVHNSLSMSEDPPKAILTEYGKVIHGSRARHRNISPRCLRAPEVNGQKYTKKLDCWNAGLVLCELLPPDLVVAKIKAAFEASKLFPELT